MRGGSLVAGRIWKPNDCGSPLDCLLQEDGVLAAVEAVSIRRVVAMRTIGRIDRGETFGDFLSKDGLLAETEEVALRAVAADRKKVRIKAPNCMIDWCSVTFARSIWFSVPADPTVVQILF